MDNQAQTTAVNPPPGAAGDLAGLAASLAAGNEAPRPNRGGRRPFAEELVDYCRARNLAVVEAPATGATPPLPGVGDPTGGTIGQAPREAGYVVDPAFVESIARQALEGVQEWRQGVRYRFVRQIGGDHETARSHAARAVAPPGVIPAASRCTAELAEKYSLVGAYTPEGVLVACLAAWWAKDRAEMRELRQLAEELKANAEKPPAK